MRMKKYLLTTFEIIAIVTILIVMFFSFSLTVNAEEIEDTQEDSIASSTYEEAKDTAEDIIEKVELKEYLSRYFDDNMVDLIVSVVVSILAWAIIIVSAIILLKKYINEAKKSGIKSDASIEIGKKMVEQCGEVVKGFEDFKTKITELSKQYPGLKEDLENVSKEIDGLKTISMKGFCSNPQLVTNGVADEIKNSNSGE